jgi:hypothetical protein
MLQAHSFNKRIGILSGPEALLGFILLRTTRTSHGSRVISEMVSLDKGDTGQHISSVSFRNTELRLLHTMNVRFSLLDIAQRILGVTLPNFQ